MARKPKNNADYFSHDNDMRNDDKIKAVRRMFGHMGYAVWNMMLEKLCKSNDFTLEHTELNIELWSGDFNVSVEELKEVINYFIKLDLLTSLDGMLFSEKMIERFSGLISKRERQTRSFHERKSIPHKIRRSLFNSFGYICQYCSEEKSDKSELVIDHFVPVSKGGDNSEENLICSCIRCNAVKSDMMPYEFISKGYDFINPTEFLNNKFSTSKINFKSNYVKISTSEIKNNSISDVESTQSKVKESKVKESKAEREAPTLHEIVAFFESEGFSKEHAEKAYKYYQDANWHDSRGKPVLNLKQKLRANWMKDSDRTQVQLSKTQTILSEYEQLDKKLELKYGNEKPTGML